MNTRTTLLTISGALLVLGLVNAAVLQNETRLRNGRTIYLQHAPVDPRSLMQGDYMILNYRINREANAYQAISSAHPRGHLVLKLDSRQVATFARLDDGRSELAPEEVRLRYRLKRDRRLITAPESFFFQEGHGQRYEKARFSKLRVTADGTALLVDLADDQLRLLSKAPEDK